MLYILVKGLIQYLEHLHNLNLVLEINAIAVELLGLYRFHKLCDKYND